MVGQERMDALLAEISDNFLEMTKHNSLDPLMLRLYQTKVIVRLSRQAEETTFV